MGKTAKSTLSATQIGMILILVPVIFELCFVAVLTYMLVSAEKNFAELERSKRVVEALRSVENLLTASAITMGTGDSGTRLSELERMLGKLEHPETMQEGQFPHSPELMQLHKDLDAARLDTLKFFREGHRILADPALTELQKNDQFNVFMRNNRPVLVQIVMEVGPMNSRLTEFESQVASAEPKEMEQLQKYLTMVMTVAVVCSIFICVGLARMFTRNLQTGLSHIAENARRIAVRERLLPGIEGESEIAQLDRILHESENTLIYLRQKELAVLDHAETIICSLDDKLKFTDVSATVKRLWQFEEDEVAGLSLLSLLRRDTVENTRQKFQQILEGTGYGDVENIIRTKDGKMMHCLWNVRWSSDSQKFYCVVHDITAKRNLERLQQRLVSIVSHDLRAPLTAIGINLTMAAEGKRGDLAEPVLAEVTKCEAEVERLMGLINSLLESERKRRTSET